MKPSFRPSLAVVLLLSLLALFSCASAPGTPVASPVGTDDKIFAGTDPGKPEAVKSASEDLARAAPKDAKPLGEGEKAPKKDGAAPVPMSVPARTESGAGSASGTAAGKSAPSQSGLKAGFSDDNAQFSYFVNFLEKFAKEVDHYPLNIQERITISVLDAAGKPVSNASIDVKAGGKSLFRGKTYADGTFMLYPGELGARENYIVEATVNGMAIQSTVSRNGPRSVILAAGTERAVPSRIPLDMLFVMDTTGSMGEEIERLRSTIEIIHTNLALVQPKPEIRFGLVLYKDVEDAGEPRGYRTKIVPFTSDLDRFQAELDKVTAEGGGDTPEDLQAALEDAVLKMAWSSDGIRLAFVVTDAPAHLDYGQTYTYAQAARDAKRKAIKFFTIGTGGLPLEGEYLLRQLSQFTQAKYIFLTYGEKGESSGGAEGSVSHHTGSNFTSDKLEAIIMKFAKEELAWLSDVPVVSDEGYFDAKKIADEKKDATLLKLFSDALANLSDYSTFKVTTDTKVALVPLELHKDADPGLASQAEYFSEQIQFAALKSALFSVVERKDLQKILKEIELQYSMLADDAQAAKLGKLLGAEVMVGGTVFRKDDTYELYLKLIRVETAEVLSVTKARLSADLGL